MKKVIVIGAGPAGMLAASRAADRGLDVTIIEKNERVGKKLLITGKGRCNITNASDIETLIENVVRNGKFLYSAFYTFTNDDVINMFNEYGVATKVERGNRVFPESDRAYDVCKALEKMIKSKKVKTIFNSGVKNILQKDNKIVGVVLDDNKKIECDSVILATGGKSYQRTGSDGYGYTMAQKLGHTITRIKPSLVGLETIEKYEDEIGKLSLRNIAIKVYTNKNKKIYEDFGEMEFTSYGIDGPVIKSSSSVMDDMSKENYKIFIDLKPGLTQEKLDKRIQNDFIKYKNNKYKDSLKDLLPRQSINTIIKLSKIDPNKQVNAITKEERENLVKILKNFEINIKRYRPIEEAIVTSGGVSTKEIDPKTMQSKKAKGLFFAGEVIDVDAYTGGFNLQIAWSTAYLAAISIDTE